MWSIIGTAVQGRGHERKNIPVQDKIFYHKGEVNVVALADGAGSAKFSHFGAEKAVEAVCSLLRDRFDDIFQRDNAADAQRYIVDEILLPLEELSKIYQQPLSEFASTLLSVAVKNNKILILHLGDGEIGAIKNDKLMSISSSENGEYVNSTYFTTSANAARHLKLFRSTEAHLFSCFFLMSDGTANSLYSRKSKNFSPIIEQLSQQSKMHKEEILNGLLKGSFETLIKQKTSDDCSFIMMTAVDKLPGYLSLNHSEKDLLFSYLKNPRHCSIKKWDRIAGLLKTPLTFKQLVKSMHVKQAYVKDNLRALQRLGIVIYENGKFHLDEIEWNTK